MHSTKTEKNGQHILEVILSAVWLSLMLYFKEPRDRYFQLL